MEREDLIISLLRDSRSDIKDIKEDISAMKIDVALNKQDLQEHMLQTKLVDQKTTHNKEYFDKRIDLIEKKLTVGYLLKLTVIVASGVSAVSGAIYGVIRLISH